MKNYIELLEAQFRKPVLMYHGTASSIVPSILSNGIVPFPKKRTWDSDEPSISMPTRESYGGSYWASNFMTAYSASHKATTELSGNRLIVAAQIQQQGAFSDEDTVSSMLKYCFRKIEGRVGGEYYLVLAYLYGKYTDHNIVDDFIDVFIKGFNADFNGLHKRTKIPFPREFAEQIIAGEAHRQIAHMFADTRFSESNRARILYLLEQGGILDYQVQSVAETEKDFLELRGKLTRLFKFRSYDNDRTALRVEDVVGYSGANKILAIVEFDVNDRENKSIILHYGKIPKEMKAAYKSSIGHWPRVYDARGRLIDKGEKNPFAKETAVAPLSEALIAIPKKTYTDLWEYVEFMVLWWAQDRIRGHEKRYPDAAMEFSRLVSQYGNFPKDEFPKKDGMVVKSFPLDFSDMPDNYKKLKSNRDTILLGVDFRKIRKSLAVFIPDRNGIIMSPLSIDFLERWPKGDSGDLAVALEQMKETLAHEVRHLVQYALLADVDKSQIEMKAGYDDMKKDYFTSNIEFDPSIGSAAEEFVFLFRLYGRPNDLSKCIKQFVGAIKVDRFGTFTTQPFFKHIRSDNRRWRIAVKKFIGEVRRRLS